MQIQSAKFQTSAKDLEACPASSMEEYAFIGRSNVGKSSLINMIIGQKGMAKVSGTPGKTKLINFFTMNNAWSLVDLPGYGYAKTGKDERAGFVVSIANYLEKRRNLKCVFVLIDAKLEPMQIDLEFLNWLRECKVSYVIVFTKMDKASAGAAQKNISLFKAALKEWKIEVPRIFKTSSTQMKGRREILDYIGETAPKENKGSKENKKKPKTMKSLGWASR